MRIFPGRRSAATPATRAGSNCSLTRSRAALQGAPVGRASIQLSTSAGRHARRPSTRASSSSRTASASRSSSSSGRDTSRARIAVQRHQPGDAVATEVARPQIAAIMSVPRVRCTAVRPWSACSRRRRPCHADTLIPITCPLRNRNRPVMPEGHTLHRLARGLNEAFAGRVVAASSPQGRFAESAAVIDQTILVEASRARQASVL